MKKLLSILMLMAFVPSLNAESFTKGGETYTYTVTSTSTPKTGIKHTRMRFSAPSSCNVSIVEVDLTNPNLRVEAFTANDSLLQLEAMTKFYTRKKNAGRNPIVTQNGHFWSMSSQSGTSAGVHATQTLLGGCMVNGSIQTETNYVLDQWNGGPTRHGILGITSAGKAVIGNYQTIAKVMCPSRWGTSEDSNSLLITEVNKYCIASDYMAMFTPEYPKGRAMKVLNTSAGQPGTEVTGTATEVYLKLDAGQKLAHNSWVECTVGAIKKNTSGGTRGSYDFVLVAAPGVSQNVLASVAVGDKMKIKYYWQSTGSDASIPAFENVIAGNAIVMKDGAVTTRATDESYNTTSYARSLYGINSDGSKLYMCVVDKGSNSTEGISYGATCTRASYIMNHFGAQTVLQVDGGGSAQMAINGSLVTKPADGSERSVASGIAVYEHTSGTVTEASIKCTPQSIELTGEVGSTANIYKDVKVVATGLSKAMSVNSKTSAITVEKLSDWDELTGGTLRLKLNTNFVSGAGTYESLVAVQSSDYRAEIATKVTLTEPSSTTTPTIEVSATSVSMKANVGKSKSKSITVTGTDLTGSITATLSGDEVFTINNKTLDVAGGTIKITYKPTAVGSHSATLKLTSSGATAKTIKISGTATEAPTISVSPSSVSMNAEVGKTATSSISVTGANLTGDVTATLSGDGAFTIDNATLGTSGGTIKVTYKPTAAGSHSATLTLESNGATAKTVTISGTATASTTPEVGVKCTPESIELSGEVGSTANIYKDVKVVGTGLSSDITYNSATSAITVEPLDGWDARAGGTLRLKLNTNFSKGAGTYESFVAVQSTSSYRVEIATKVTLTEPAGGTKNPIISVSSSSVSMNAKVGETATSSIVVTGADLSGNISASLAGDGVFTIDNTSLGTSGGTIKVTYKPTAAGSHSATLRLASTGAASKTVSISGTATAASAPSVALGLTKVWQNTSSVPGTATGGDIRFAAVSNGNLLAVDKGKLKIIKLTENGSSDYYDCSSALSTHWNVSNTMGPAIGCDDAGNILVHCGWSGATSGSKFMIISADLKNTYKLDLSTVDGYTAARVDQIGRIRGNMLSSEGGYAFIVPNGGTSVLVVKIKNGAIDADYTQLSNPITGVGLSTSCCPQPAFETVDEIDALMDENNDLSNAFIMRNRTTSGSVFAWKTDNSDMEKAWTFTATTQGYSTENATVEGFDWFKLSGKSYFIMPLTTDGTTATRGSIFGIFDEDGVEVAVWSEGEKTGLGTCFGSFIAVPIDDTSVNIYHFVPGTVAEKFTFAVKSSAVEGLEMENADAPIEYYNLQGVKVANPSNGIFIKVQGSKASKVYIK